MTEPATSLLSVRDLEAMYERHSEVLEEISASQVSAKQRDPRLGDITDLTDKEQVAAVKDVLSRRVITARPAEHDPRTEVRIGTTWMTVPPSAINVNEVRYNENIPGLRSTTNSLVKTGRGQIRIDMELEFPNPDAVNKELREIIAQFRLSPFLPLESNYIFNHVLAAAAEIDPARLDDAKTKIQNRYDRYIAIRDQMVELIQGEPALITAIANKHDKSIDDTLTMLRGYIPSEIADEVVDTLPSYRSIFPGTDNTDLTLSGVLSAASTMQAIVELKDKGEKALNEIRDTHQELYQAGLPEASRRPTVPVVLSSLEIITSPAGNGELGALKARLSCIYFAYGPYTQELVYKDANGNPTLDLAESPYYRYYIRSRYLDMTSGNEDNSEENFDLGRRPLGTVSVKGGQTFVFKYPIPRYELVDETEPGAGDLAPRVKPEEVSGRAAANFSAKKTEEPKVLRAQTETLQILNNDTTIIPQQVSVTIRNRIALQPIHGGLYGTAQHLGTINADIAIAFNVHGNSQLEHDRGVAKIQRMKLESERVALIGGPKTRRNHRIRVFNDILNLCGIRYVQIDRVGTSTNKGEVYSSTVVLRCSEYTVSQQKREALRLARPDATTSMFDAVLGFGIRIADEWRMDEQTTEKGLFSQQSDSGSYFRNMLYGTGETQGGPGFFQNYGGLIAGGGTTLLTRNPKLGLKVGLTTNFVAAMLEPEETIDEGILNSSLITQVLWNNATIKNTIMEHVRNNRESQIPEHTPDEPFGLGSRTTTSGVYGAARDVAEGPLFDSLRAFKKERQEAMGEFFAPIKETVQHLRPRPFQPESTADITHEAERMNQAVFKESIGHVIRLAREMRKHWRTWMFADDPRTVRDSKGIIDIPPNPQEFMEEILNEIKDPDFEEERSDLWKMVEYARDNFPEVRETIKSRMRDSRGVSTYPDLDLPTYADIILGAADIVGNLLGSPIGGLDDKLLQAFNSKTLGEEAKTVLRRFMPTWRDLGKIPPVGQDPYDIAKAPDDHVDPDFFYFHQRLSHLYDSFEAEVQDEIKSLYRPSSNVYDPDIGRIVQTKGAMADARRTQEARWRSLGMSQKYIDRNSNSSDDVTDNQDLLPNPDGTYAGWKFKDGMWEVTQPVAGYGTQSFQRYAPAEPALQQKLGKFIHDDPRHLSSLFREVSRSIKDDRNRMVRAFPTFRLYFIEVDNEEWGFWDDFYGYGAVVDIQMSQHKFEPSLLQIRLLNTTGNLDEARSHMGDPDRTADDLSWYGPDGQLRDPRAPVNDSTYDEGTGEKRELDKFFLQTGTSIVLKMGYGSADEDLEVVFTGQVAEFRPGDVTTLICQDYSTELTVPLNTWKGSSAEAYSIIKWVLENSPSTHYGEWSPYEVGLLKGIARDGTKYNRRRTRVGWDGYRTSGRGRQDLDMAGQRYSEVAEALNPLSHVDGAFDYMLGGSISDAIVGAVAGSYGRAQAYFQSYYATRKMLNVFLPRHSALRSFLEWGLEFLIPDRSGLEVLHELTRHLPGGYVAKTRPFDHKATLFFGKPEQRYFYTLEKQDEEVLWEQLNVEADREIEGAIVRLIQKFEKDALGQAFKALLHTRETQWGETWKSAAAYLNPGGVMGAAGRVLGTATFGLLGPGKDQRDRVARETKDKYVEPSEGKLAELSTIETYLGERSLKLLVAYFFDRYASKFGLMDEPIEDLLGGLWGMITFNPIEAVSSAVTAGGGAIDLFTGNTGYTSGAKAGTILVSLSNWREAVDAISAEDPGTKKFRNGLRYQIFQLHDERMWLNAFRDTTPKVLGETGQALSLDGRPISRDQYEMAVNSIIDYLPDWKVFLSTFATYLELQLATGDTDLMKDVYAAGKKAEQLGHNPRTKRFRDHHYVDSVRDIISNKIVATKEQMANTVVIKYPDNIDYASGGGRYFLPNDVDWQTLELPADENIQPSEKKVRIITEINIEDYPKAMLAAFNNLAEALRPMYRGELILRGNERIKPFDIIWINDPYENMYGPVEAERVITHFSPETGFTTTVIPHAVTVAQSSPQYSDALAAGWFNSWKAIGLTYNEYTKKGLRNSTIGAVAGSFIPSFGIGTMAGWTIGGIVGGVEAVIGGARRDWELNEQTGAGIWGNMMGRGRYGPMRIPVSIIPLVRNGRPWTAGLRGWGDSNWKMRNFKRWADIHRGTGRLWQFTGKVWSNMWSGD